MSRIYDNKPLQSIPVVTITWPSSWHSETWQKQSGKGVLIDGTVISRSRFIIKDTNGEQFRYYVFHVKVNRCHRRKFDSSGKEIEPNFSQTHKVSTGYLPSSYKIKAKGETDRLSAAELRATITIPSLQEAIGKAGSIPEESIPLLLEESQLEKMDIENQDEIRVKTKWDCPFVFSLGKIDAQSSTVSNFAGGATVGASWTDKVMQVKGSGNTQGESQSQGQGEGVDDDEWDD